MTRNRTNLAREVFDGALEQEPERRHEYVQKHCRGDPELRDEVASLLAAYNEAESFLEPPAQPAAASRSNVAAQSQPFPTIAGYRIRRVLGEGGMGVVFEAEQEQPRRDVALKVVRGGRFVDQHVLRLFEREAQTLARLRHPNIAAVYEVGRTEDGQQFFAMEFVPGVPLDRYIDDKHPSIEAKLKLFRRVCEAIHHAHQHGVIHRDLKPSNIMIDAEGHPKILDFGLAKITDSDVALTTVSTAVGKIQGTLAYMSPEQARGEPHDIGLLSDVYALGVILYELATGRPPYDTHGRTLPEAVRVICEQPPQRRSTINQSCPAELQTIALKALEKEPTRRYQSAAALAEDIDRFLKRQPILARPPSTLYQFRKLVARHKLPFALLTALFLVLAGSSVWMAVLYRRAGGAEREALSAASTAGHISTFLQDMLASVDPSVALGRDTTLLRELLERTARRVDTELANEPIVAAEIHRTIGNTYRTLGLLNKAETHLTRSLEALRSALPTEELKVAGSIHDLAALMDEKSDYDRAEELFRESLVIRKRKLGLEHVTVAETLHGLAKVLTHKARYAEAEPLLREALAMCRKLVGTEHAMVTMIMNDLALFLYYKGEYGESEKLFREALTIRRRQLGEVHPYVANGLNNVASILQVQGEFAEAEPLLREALTIRRALLDDDHPDIANSLNNLAVVLQNEGKLDDAEPLLREALVIFRNVHGNEHPTVAAGLTNLAILLKEQGDYAQAEPLLREAVSMRRTLLGDRHPDVAYSLLALAEVLLSRRDPEAAAALAREALSIRQEALAETHWLTAHTRGVVGSCLAALGDFEESEKLLLASYQGLKATRGTSDRYSVRALERIVDLYSLCGRPGKVAEYRAMLPKADKASASPAP